MDLQVFDFNNVEFNILIENGNPLFPANEIAKILELKSGSDAARYLDDDEKLLRELRVSGQKRTLIFITESGLYSLILKSKKPQSKPFQSWVTKEVLPSIRKTGSYSKDVSKELSLAEMFLQIAQVNVDQEKKIIAINNRMDLIEAKTTTKDDFFTVAGYAKWHGLKAIPTHTAGAIGKKVKKICDLEGLQIEKTKDTRFGFVNVYPEYLIKEVIETEYPQFLK